MDAHRDALAHRFIAHTVSETRGWPAHLQIGLHELAFTVLPELVLELRGEQACAWARRWRQRMEAELAAGGAQVAPEDVDWVAELARRRAAPAPAGEPPANPADIQRLAGLLERLGPVAMALPWRREPPARA